MILVKANSTKKETHTRFAYSVFSLLLLKIFYQVTVRIKRFALKTVKGDFPKCSIGFTVFRLEVNQTYTPDII